MRSASKQLAALSALVCSSAAAHGQLTERDIAALQSKGAADGWTFTVGKNAVSDVPIEELCGLVEPPGWQERATFDPGTPNKGPLDLPVSFDWRTQAGCPPIRDQGSCGACWAFSTVGALECAIYIKDGKAVDLSEQWLISCNREGWGCIGGWFAHDYHQWKTDSCGGSGAVMESAFPYAAASVPCACPYDHEYRIDSWAYIGSSGAVPGVDAIKQAILVHGPVSVAVYASAAFHGYTGGVFNACENITCNHAVVLVGWDDTQGAEGVWLVRNSWGTGWGEAGYMRIAYGCSNIGYGACYVNYPGWDDLAVDPGDGFASSGEPGGPFTPQDTVYTLMNQGESPIDWTVTHDQAWVEAAPSGGTLTSGASVNVTVSILPDANTLPVGTYTDTMRFTNTTTGKNRARTMMLTVGRPDYFSEHFLDGDNDLSGRSLALTPNGSVNYYSACSESITALPTDPAGGTLVPLTDDSYAEISLNGVTVSIYGQPTPTFYIGSNGYITFDAGDTDTVPTFDRHFNRRRISGLYLDLNPEAGGAVSWEQLPDRVVVTWLDIRQYGALGGNTFQVEMYLDGRIRIAWLQIAALHGVAGLSNGGGIPVGFLESDLSAYAACPDPSGPGDLDHDGDVDSVDYTLFEACLTGPDATGLAPDCEEASLDYDGDVDLADFHLFERWFSGVGVGSRAGCGQ